MSSGVPLVQRAGTPKSLRDPASRRAAAISAWNAGVYAPAHINALLLILLLVVGGCERERRSYRDALPGSTAAPQVQTSELQAGPTSANPSLAAYQDNRWAVSQGQMLYSQFNCAGCHSPGGGGGMGPALTDDDWIYGSQPENVFATIIEGRPNGMPSFRGKIANPQVWQLVAYVRSLSGLTPRDTWPARSDHMQQTKPEREPPLGQGFP